MKKGKRFNIYVNNNLIGAFMKMQKLAYELNVSVLHVIIDDRYRDNVYVADCKKELKRKSKSEEIMTRIINRVRDSYLFNNCMASSLALDKNKVSSSVMVKHFQDELEILELNDLDKKTKSKFKKMIKEQLRNYKKHIKKRIITIPDSGKGKITFTDTDGNPVSYTRKDGR